MTLKDDLSAEVKKLFVTRWDVTTGRVVPAPTDVGLGSKAVLLEKAVVLYADMAGSTKMVDGYKWCFSAEIYKAYLFCAAKIVKFQSGTITAYDGDRIMAVFIGEDKCDRAAKAGLQLQWAVKNIIAAELKSAYPNTNFVVSHSIGIDISDVHVARTGVRGDNDLVWVGRAANYAAKLTDLYADLPTTWITKDVHDGLSDSVRKSSSGENMWKKWLWTKMDNKDIYSSNWTWSFS